MPAAEDASSRIFRVLDRSAAQHRDAGGRIEDGDVDRGFHRVDGGLVLGVEVARIAGDQMDGLAAPLQRDRSEIQPAVGGKLGELLGDVRARQQHRVAEMPAALLMSEHVRQQNALVDLAPVLVALEQRVLFRDLLA